MELRLHTKLVSGLEKVFSDREPEELKTPLSLLKDDIAVFQLAVRPDTAFWMARFNAEVTIESPIADLVTVRRVELMPVMASIYTPDEDFLSDQPGLYPDLLRDAENGVFHVMNRQWNAFWIEVETTPETEAGAPSG